MRLNNSRRPDANEQAFQGPNPDLRPSPWATRTLGMSGGWHSVKRHHGQESLLLLGHSVREALTFSA